MRNKSIVNRKNMKKIVRIMEMIILFCNTYGMKKQDEEHMIKKETNVVMSENATK